MGTMSDNNCTADITTDLSTKIIGRYALDAAQAISAQENLFQQLLRHRKLLETGWSEQMVENFLHKLAVMDSNNFIGQVGAGEREGRVICPIISRRHFRLSHGVGRSGDVTAIQPKAAGSSLANQLTNSLLLDAIQICGIRSCKACFLVPTATGMALMLCLLYFKRKNLKGKYVLWSRVDQKTCFKCIKTAGLEPVVIEPILVADELSTDSERFEQLAESIKEEVLCCVTTTSCFAPRGPDRLVEISKLCQKLDLPHLINNAYGLQSSKCCHLVEEAARLGRVDAFVQSTDKNFMVPVGGAVIAGFDKKLVDEIAKTYPGRASAAPCIDVLCSLLWLGSDEWKELLKERKEIFQYLKTRLRDVAEKHGERVLESKNNQISLAMSLSTFDALIEQKNPSLSVSELGSMLFKRCCTGARVVQKEELKIIEGHKFHGWGGSVSHYPCSYLNVAGAVGMKKQDVDTLETRLDKTLTEFRKRLEKVTRDECENNKRENGCCEETKVIVI